MTESKRKRNELLRCKYAERYLFCEYFTDAFINSLKIG